MADILFEKHNYIDKNKNCIINLPIRAYDMKSGGYSILKKYKCLSKKEIKYLDDLPKYERNVYLGKKIRKDNLSEILMNGFIDARKRFMYYNDICDEDILSIKKDALFVINRPAVKLEFDGYTFKVEDVFSSYYNLNDKEFYYSNKDFRIELKGINDDVLKLHRDFFLYDLCSIFRLCEGQDTFARNKFLQNYRSDYINKRLDIGCYRELNADSCFSYIMKLANQRVLVDDTNNIDDIDIIYNYKNYLMELFRLIL